MPDPKFLFAVGDHGWVKSPDGIEKIENVLIFVYKNKNKLYNIEYRILEVFSDNTKKRLDNTSSNLTEDKYQMLLRGFISYFGKNKIDVFRFKDNSDFDFFVKWGKEREKRLMIELEDTNKT